MRGGLVSLVLAAFLVGGLVMVQMSKPPAAEPTTTALDNLTAEDFTTTGLQYAPAEDVAVEICWASPACCDQKPAGRCITLEALRAFVRMVRTMKRGEAVP